MSTMHRKDTPGELTIVSAELNYPRVSLTEPTTSSYLHLAAEVDSPLSSLLPVFLFDSRKKRQLIAICKELCHRLSELEWVVEVTVFKATIIPPGRGGYLDQTDRDVHIAKFDVIVLIEVEDGEALRRLKWNELYGELEAGIEREAKYCHVTSATNVKRIGPVDHKRDGVFLFNYFFAEDVAQNIDVWEYTAGWFETETGLDNSTLLLPNDPNGSQYALINHCRWDRFTDIIPSLLFKRSFEEYVLANFEANRVAAIPILYKLA